jgi:hypothetical protein
VDQRLFTAHFRIKVNISSRAAYAGLYVPCRNGFRERLKKQGLLQTVWTVLAVFRSPEACRKGSYEF